MIRIEGLRVTYGELVAVDGLDLHVEKGRLFALLGPNGAGKTTTISCIAGLRTPASGRILVDGVDALAEPARVRAKVGLVPQRLALYPTLSVRQNLEFFGGVHGLRGQALRDRCAWALALARLEQRADARVETLSGGMKRRLNLVCGLLHDPPLIICDEPTTGVDPQSRNHLFETIRALNAEGRTVVYTTHYMEEVEALCDTVAVIDHGRVVACDTLEGLLGDVGHRFTVEVDAGAEAVEAALAPLGVSRVAPVPRTLEQVFLELTGHALREDD